MAETERLKVKKFEGNEYVQRARFNENYDQIDSGVAEVEAGLNQKIDAKIQVTDNPPAVADREPGAFYFNVTDKQPIGNGGDSSTMRVSPTMGIKKKEE
ncbi:hypothetical protein [Aureibacillus halotolerans]|uniref:Uncharacterized protein n=1 Tax=Aureibacillus halotolerans TaxID=1508390 RepID=A0A4R6TTK0_9BACI|nr:hypothetical protein [Aureibacillus halotolerans]TDQ35293.1 hypothetical protein EV213_12280 [Aureibacillus halotolerans]